MGHAPVVLGIDLGITATQDAVHVRDAAIEALAECVAWAKEHDHPVAALSFSTSMHTLVGLDSAGAPATRSFNWADTQAAEVAARLRSEGDAAAALHRATGTPVHTQSVDLELAEGSGGSGLGAVLLAWRALGEFDSLERAAELVTPERKVSPDLAPAREMARRRPLVEQLHATLRDLEL
ncbi:hypothetical protein [Saccharopolyspora hattusasensis]|uniref:hypothetical protein n=1 Tax=Saccharopolyspora hattusasensis TaxID=1128679 RepID=UPI003D982566